MIKHRQWWGDKEYDFSLTPQLLMELERKCNCGVGGLSRRLFSGEYRYSELTEIIRLALIGGGAEHEEASALVAAYCIPVMPAYGLAVAILEVTIFGAKPDNA